MEIALVTWWTSGIWKEVSKYLLHKDIFSVVTWSRNSYKTRENEKYTQFDQSTDSKITEKITTDLKYVFLNAGVFYPDDASNEDLEYMEKVNYQSNMAILQDLHENGFLKNANIIVNASIQVESPRDFAKKYAETKKKLTESTLEYAKQKGINLCVIWPSAIFGTPMIKKFINYCISKWMYENESDFREKVAMIDLKVLIEKIDDIYFGNNYEEFKHKFIPVKQ